MKNTKMPAIRFKGFNDDWEQRKFGDLADYKKGPFGSALKKDIFVPKSDTTVKVYEQQNAINKDWHLERYFITEKYANKLSGFRVEGGDIIVSCAGTIGETYELPMDAEPGIINQALMKIKVKESIVNKKMFNILFTNMIDDFTRVHSNGSAIKNIPPFSDLKPMEVFVPEINEQNKISFYFSNLDRLITLHQRKLEKIKLMKKSMLGKMFSRDAESVPKIRFDGYTDDWEQCKWMNSVDISTEMVDPASGKYDDMPHIAPGNIESFTGQILDNVRTVKEEQLISGKFRFRPDDVVYGKINPQLGKYFYASVDGLTSADAYVFKGKNGIRQKFLFSMLQTSDFFKYSVSVSKRSGMPKINRDELNAYAFLAPSEEEQDKIGNFLLEIDHLITLHQRKLEKLKKVKKSLLEHMFPMEK